MKPRTLTEEDIAYIKANFTYDPETGEITRKRRKHKGRIVSHTTRGYIRFSSKGRKWRAHRIALVLCGEDVNDKEVDHINGNRSDNRRCNLRLVDKLENLRNQKKRTTNTSGVMGVFREKNKWRSRITAENGNLLNLGYFDNFFEAVCARKSAENRLGYHPNHGRR